MAQTYGSGLALLIILAAMAAFFLILYVRPSKGSPPRAPPPVDPPRREKFTRKQFYIYNYLKKPVRVEVLPSKDWGMTTTKPKTLIESIPAGGRVGISQEDVVEYIRKGHVFKFYVKGILDPSKDDQSDELFSVYTLSRVPTDKTIRSLHIGMVTSRWVQTSSRDVSTWAYPEAIQAYPWLKIHNMTGRYLNLNNNIDISPHGTLRYTGRHHFGVSLGTIFKDQDGLFPDYKYKVPATDLYYGVISDIDQSLYGGYQMDSVFQDDPPQEPVFLLNNGWVGGPAKGNIPNGYIPREGPPTPLVDRWGKLIGKEGELVSGYYPLDKSSLDALPSRCVMRATQ